MWHRCWQHLPSGTVMKNCCHHCWRPLVLWLGLNPLWLVHLTIFLPSQFIIPFSLPSPFTHTQSPSLLPFLLHLQSLHSSPDSKLAIFYSIPTLATHKLATVGVVNTLRTLGGSPSLIAIVTRLIGKVWQWQDHIFPQVREFLLRSPPSSISPIIAREIALARAAVIRDICCLRYETIS